MDTVALNSGVATTIADSDLVAVADSGGALKPVSFANLMAAVRGAISIGGRNYVLKSGTYNDNANNGTYRGLGVCSFNTEWSHQFLSLSEPMIVGETYTLSYYFKGGHHYVVPLNVIMTGNSSNQWSRKIYTFKVTSDFNPEQLGKIRIAKGVGQDTGNDLSVCGIKLERGNIATDWSPAPEDIASGSWGGVIVRYSNTYDSAKKGGPHADGGDCGCAGECADGILSFGSLCSLERAVEYLCEVVPADTYTQYADMCGCERCDSRLDADEQYNTEPSNREEWCGWVYTDPAIRCDCEDSALLLLGGCPANLRTKTHVWDRQRYLAELESNLIVAERKEVAYADR